METVEKLVEYPQVVGFKDGYGNMELIIEVKPPLIPVEKEHYLQLEAILNKILELYPSSRCGYKK